MSKGAKGDGHEDQSESLEVWLVFLLCHWAMLDEISLP